MIPPHPENDSRAFEANVLIVHFPSRSSMSATLHQRRHAHSAVEAKKRIESIMKND